MQNSFLFQLLRGLDRRDLRELRKLVQSPFFNLSENVQFLLEKLLDTEGSKKFETERSALTESEGNGYDKIIKENLEEIFRPLIEKKLGIKILKSIPLKDKMQTTIEVEMDSFYDVTPESGEPFILHLEFESGDNPKMVYRVSEYHGIALKEREREIKHIVIYLGMAAPTMRTTLKPEEVFTGFELLDVHGLDIENLLSSQVPGVVLIAILADYPPENAEKILRRVLENVKKLTPDEHQLRKYVKQVLVLARLREINFLATKIIEEMPITFNIDIEKDVLYLRGEAKGIEKGTVKGIKESIDVFKHWQKGMEPPLIANVLNLPIAEVEQIIAEFLKD